jgi:hypothetical protein
MMKSSHALDDDVCHLYLPILWARELAGPQFSEYCIRLPAFTFRWVTSDDLQFLACIYLPVVVPARLLYRYLLDIKARE